VGWIICRNRMYNYLKELRLRECLHIYGLHEIFGRARPLILVRSESVHIRSRNLVFMIAAKRYERVGRESLVNISASIIEPYVILFSKDVFLIILLCRAFRDRPG
jgi:hypothetical protein